MRPAILFTLSLLPYLTHAISCKFRRGGEQDADAQTCDVDQHWCYSVTAVNGTVLQRDCASNAACDAQPETCRSISNANGVAAYCCCQTDDLCNEGAPPSFLAELTKTTTPSTRTSLSATFASTATSSTLTNPPSRQPVPPYRRTSEAPSGPNHVVFVAIVAVVIAVML